MTDQLSRVGYLPPYVPGEVAPSHHHAAHNKAGTAALGFGATGVIVGSIPLLFPVAAMCGVLALVFGVRAWRRVRTGVATNVRTTRAALILAVVALLLALVGFFGALVATDLVPPPKPVASSTS